MRTLCEHRIHFDGERHYSLWCRKTRGHADGDFHSYWSANGTTKWTDEGVVVEDSSASVWVVGETYRTTGPS